LDEPRSVDIGLVEYLRYCLRLSSCHFAMHYSFLFVAFDVIAKQRAFNAIGLRIKHNPRIATNSGALRGSDLEQLCAYQRERLEALRSHKRLPSVLQLPQSSYDFSSGVETAVRAFYGSDKERQTYRTNLFSMAVQYGQPSIFLTLSPCTSRLLTVANLCGEASADEISNFQRRVETLTSFTAAKLAALSGKNPYACTRYVFSARTKTKNTLRTLNVL
jgi:hypothetical protein